MIKAIKSLYIIPYKYKKGSGAYDCSFSHIGIDFFVFRVMLKRKGYLCGYGMRKLQPECRRGIMQGDNRRGSFLLSGMSVVFIFVIIYLNTNRSLFFAPGPFQHWTEYLPFLALNLSAFVCSLLLQAEELLTTYRGKKSFRLCHDNGSRFPGGNDGYRLYACFGSFVRSRVSAGRRSNGKEAKEKVPSGLCFAPFPHRTGRLF